MSRNLIAGGSPVGGRSILEGVRHASTCFPLLVDPGRDSKEWRQPREPLRWFAPVASIDPRSAHKDHRRVGAGRGRLWSGHHQVEPLVLPRKRTFAAQIPARPVWTRPGSARFARTTRSWPSTTSRRLEALRGLAHRAWPWVLNAFAQLLNPILPAIRAANQGSSFWVQAEIATDVMFKTRRKLLEIWPDLVNHASLTTTPEDVSGFLGRAEAIQMASPRIPSKPS
jgi:hypothetical protein